MASILIIGSDRPESLEMSYSRAFLALGWKLRRWDPMRALKSTSRGGRAGRTLASFVNVEPWKRKANVELLQVVDELKPDVLLVIAADGLRAGTLAQARVLAPNCRFLAAYPDSAHSLDPERIACLSACDRVGVSAPDWVPAFRKLVDCEIRYLPFAADTLLYQPTSPAPIEWDIGFVGTWRPEREALLEAMSQFRTRVWGSSYWKTRTAAAGKVRDMWAGAELVGDGVSAACSRTAIMLNILDPITWPGPNMRSFELPACRAFTLSSRSPPILEIFREGESIECFASASEALDKARHYVTKPELRARIAQAAHETVLRGGHTYLERAQSLASWV